MSSLNADGSPGYINAVFVNVRPQLRQGVGAAERSRARADTTAQCGGRPGHPVWRCLTLGRLHSDGFPASGALLPGDGPRDQPKPRPSAQAAGAAGCRSCCLLRAGNRTPVSPAEGAAGCKPALSRAGVYHVSTGSALSPQRPGCREQRAVPPARRALGWIV